MGLPAVLFVFVIVLSAAIAAQAQITTGNIIGIVHDESGAVLPGVSVAVIAPALICPDTGHPTR